MEGATDDPERAAEPADRIDLAVTCPADHETDLDDRATAERREHAPEFALPGLAGAAEQLYVGEAPRQPPARSPSRRGANHVITSTSTSTTTNATASQKAPP